MEQSPYTSSKGTPKAVGMQDARVGRAVAPDEYIPFFATGENAKGEFHCSDCGYGVTVHRELPRCPMCGGDAWEQTAWSPFMHVHQRL